MCFITVFPKTLHHGKKEMNITEKYRKVYENCKVNFL